MARAARGARSPYWSQRSIGRWFPLEAIAISDGQAVTSTTAALDELSPSLWTAAGCTSSPIGRLPNNMFDHVGLAERALRVDPLPPRQGPDFAVALPVRGLL